MWNSGWLMRIWDTKKSKSLTGKQALKLELICAISMEFSDKLLVSQANIFCIFNILRLGNKDVTIKVKLFTLLLRKEWEIFARNYAWNTGTADKTLFLLDKHWNCTENEKLKNIFLKPRTKRLRMAHRLISESWGSQDPHLSLEPQTFG